MLYIFPTSFNLVIFHLLHVAIFARYQFQVVSIGNIFQCGHNFLAYTCTMLSIVSVSHHPIHQIDFQEPRHDITLPYSGLKISNQSVVFPFSIMQPTLLSYIFSIILTHVLEIPYCLGLSHNVSLIMLPNAFLKSIQLLYNGACHFMDCSNVFLKMYDML